MLTSGYHMPFPLMNQYVDPSTSLFAYSFIKPLYIQLARLLLKCIPEIFPFLEKASWLLLEIGHTPRLKKTRQYL